MEQINYERLIPREPPEDLVTFAYRQGCFQHAYLIYKMGREYVPLEDRWTPAVHVVCSACGEEFYARKIRAGGCGHSCAPAPFGWWSDTTSEMVIHGSETACPCCGAQAQVVHAGRIADKGLEDCVWASALSRLPVAGKRDRLVLTEWCISRLIDKRGRAAHQVHPYSAWVVEEKKLVRLTGRGTCMYTTYWLDGWTQRKTFRDDFGQIGLLLPWDKGLLEGTTAENSKLDLYLEAGGTRAVAYLALWRRRPAVENLLVQGCGHLVAELIDSEVTSYGYHGGVPRLTAVSWKEKRPAAMLGLNREELRHLRQMRWSAADLRTYKLVRDGGVPVRLPEDMAALRAMGEIGCGDVLRGAPKEDFWRVLRYLRRQGRGWVLLRDYWAMAGRLGWDLTDSLVRWPRNLLAAHDRVAGEQKCREEANLRKGFARRAAELEGYSFQADGLLIRPCRDQAELIAEGRALHHCVGTYAKRHAKGETAILFIRRADAPDTPYFTLELDEEQLRVRQNRGLRNCERTPEVRAFEAAWLAWCRAAREKGRRRSA